MNDSWSELRLLLTARQPSSVIDVLDEFDRARLQVAQAHQQALKDNEASWQDVFQTQNRELQHHIDEIDALRGQLATAQHRIADLTAALAEKPYADEYDNLERALATAQQEIERLKRHAVVDDIAFDSANTALVEAETELSHLKGATTPK